MYHSFRLRTHTGSAFLDTSTNRSLLNKWVARLAKLPQRPSQVHRIKAAGGCMLPVQQEALLFTITMGSLTSTLRAP